MKTDLERNVRPGTAWEALPKSICLRRGSKNNAPHNNEVRVLGAAACQLVEMRRVELLSENRLQKPSTSVAILLKFPLRRAKWRAQQLQ